MCLRFGYDEFLSIVLAFGIHIFSVCEFTSRWLNTFSYIIWCPYVFWGKFICSANINLTQDIEKFSILIHIQP